jgi:inhibitor of KinA sporulation pathway (predicted exonuclease)
MNFLALDLELNNTADGSTPKPKIIQVGVAIGSVESDESEWIVKKWYIDPNEPIYPEITALTGITDQDIETYAISHSDLAKELGDLISEHNCFVNPVTWGGGDSVELLQEFKDRNVEFPFFGRRWIDVKTFHLFNQIAKGKKPAGGLGSAMGIYKMPFKGLAHRADIDAFNTMRLFQYFVKRQAVFNSIIETAKKF